MTELNGGIVDGPPTFVEGQLALWYATFAARGGESDALRKSRLTLLRRASAVRARAEQAAADVRDLPWAREWVDQADALRRQAQDQLFAGEATAFKACASRLARAEALYARAIAASAQCARAIDLVQRLQDELPYYGDWQANRAEGPDDAFEALLNDSADLAGLLDAGSGKEPIADESRRKLAALTQAVEQSHTRLIADFRAGVDRRGRQVFDPRLARDRCALRVPMLRAEDRATLLDRAAAAEAPRPFPSRRPPTLPNPRKPTPTRGSGSGARALARLEIGLLKLGGRDVRDLADWQEQAWACATRTPRLPSTRLDRLSARVRELWAGRPPSNPPRGGALVEAEPVDREEGESLDHARRTLIAADRAARSLPASAINDLAGDPARKLDDFLVHSLLIWHAGRLLDDFAPEHAERLLEEARQFSSSRALWEEFGRAHALAEAAITVKGPSANQQDADAAQDLAVQVGTEGDLPAGVAALFLAHDPKGALGVVVAGEGSLIPVPIEGKGAVSRSISVALAGPRRGECARASCSPRSSIAGGGSRPRGSSCRTRRASSAWNSGSNAPTRRCPTSSC